MNFNSTMNSTAKLLFLMISILLLTSCGSDDSNEEVIEIPEEQLSSENLILDFSVNNTDATINNTSNTIFLTLPIGGDVANVTPSIVISDDATITPASGVTQNFTNPLEYTVTAEDSSTRVYTVTINGSDEGCPQAPNSFSFEVDGVLYELVLENRSWITAAFCAVEQGGRLAEINSQSEQDGIFAALNQANINLSDTQATDGGGASYVWLGGNDLAEEGLWILDGDNDGQGPQFWQGAVDGSPVDGLFNNWGMEPDNFGTGQDALSLALTDWPFGVAGQWNDLDQINGLFYLIEFD